MSHAIEIMTELEKEFDEKKAKVLTNAILKRAEESNLVTKDYLHKELSDLRVEFYKELGALRKEMSQGFVDVQKSITRMTVYFISAIGTIAVIFKVLDIVFGN